mmetsp:Transcript_88089/g.161599  ORF Transcript_88089/g.161599 Transcript_88089/m.161599 type:complete len:1502 (+) Transcript_88089:79-4584(+)
MEDEEAADFTGGQIIEQLEDDCDMLWQPWRAGEILDVLSQKGYCMLQTDFELELREQAVEEAEKLPKWADQWKQDTVAEYLGTDNCTKCSYIAEEFLTVSDDDTQVAFVECEALMILESVIAEAMSAVSESQGLTPLGATMVRIPYADRRDKIDTKPVPIENQDLEAGHVAEFLQFVRRRKLCILMLAECEGGEIELYTKDNDITLACKSNRMLIFCPDRMSYCYRPEGSSVAFQTFLLSDRIEWNPDMQMDHVGTRDEYTKFLGVDNVHIPGGMQAFVKSLALRAPGHSMTPALYWNMFCGCTDCGVEFPILRIDVDTYWQPNMDTFRTEAKSYTRHASFLTQEEFTSFDCKFFGYTEEETVIMVPGQRLQMEVGYECLYNQGFRRDTTVDRNIGIFSGDVGPDWFNLNLTWNTMQGNTENLIAGHYGTATSMGYSRLAHFLDLKGPIMTCSTACSSSLVAMAHCHHEMQDHGGKNIIFGIQQTLSAYCFIAFCFNTMLSSVGRCHTYNDTADGFMRAEGIGSTVIEQLPESKSNSERLACVAGTFSNQDGRSASMTAPHGPSQMKLIKTSLKMSNLKGDEVNIAECHGTGTALGDPIEVGAIQTALGAAKRPVPFFMTSAKSIHGHMESGAGICGFTKCIIMMNASACAPNCHFKSINPNLLFDGFPCFVTDVLADVGFNSVCCGVSSFGATGSNARADVIGYCSKGHRTVDACPAQKLEVLTRPCPQCLGDMCYLCGENVAKLSRTGGENRHRCCMVRSEGASYEVCSLCFEGKYHYIEDVKEDAKDDSTPEISISGTWTAWSKMEPMEAAEDGSYVYEAVLGETGCEQFRLHVGGKVDSAFFPVRANGDSSMHILGPQKIKDGACWMIDGCQAGLTTGAIIKIKFKLQGQEKQISWEPTGELSLQKLEEVGYEHKYFMVRGLYGAKNGLNDTESTECKDREMTLLSKDDGCYEYEVKFRFNNLGRETFRFIRDKDQAQVIYPASNVYGRNGQLDESVPIRGPNDGAGLQWFSFTGEKFENCTVKLTITSGRITVTASSSEGGVVTWKSSFDSCYCVRGAFTSWDWVEMTPDASGSVHKLSVSASGMVDFQIAVGGDESKFLYLSPLGTLQGPDAKGADKYWRMFSQDKRVLGKKTMQIVLDFTEQDRRKIVSWKRLNLLKLEDSPDTPSQDDADTAELLKELSASTLPVALVFPGQGSQYVNMLESVKDLPSVREMLEKSKDILGYDILKLCQEGPEEKLEETRYTQPAVFIGGLAAIEKLKADRPEAVENPRFMAGLSLGEYTALCAAGVFSFEDGLKLVKLRGEAMQEAAEKGKQKMLSVAGLDERKLKQLCREAKQADFAGGVCSIANALFPNGYSVGGTERSIKALKTLAEGAGAMQAKILKTGGAFHTSLMQPAQDKLSDALEMTLPKMKPPRCTIYMNATSEPMPAGSDPEKIVRNLKKQLTNTVLWEPSVKKMLAAGASEFYECGPMKQLKAMMKRIDMNAWGNMTSVEV